MKFKFSQKFLEEYPNTKFYESPNCSMQTDSRTDRYFVKNPEDWNGILLRNIQVLVQKVC